LVLNKNHW